MRRSMLLRDFFREIRRTKSRFFSIFLLCALSVAFLAGLRTTAPDMRYTADAYFDRLNLMDFQVLSTLGLTQEDVDALLNLPLVAAAEGAYHTDGIATVGEHRYVLAVQSLSQLGLNQPVVTSGRLPETANECVTEEKFINQAELSLGDSITLDTGKETSPFHSDTFTIVGTVQSPLYIYNDLRGSSALGSGRVTAFLLTTPQAFSMDAFTTAYLKLTGGDALLCYGEDYIQLVAQATALLEPLGDQRAALRQADVLAEARTKLDQARADLAQGEADGRQTLQDAKRELADARRKLDSGWNDYYQGHRAMLTAQTDGQLELDNALIALADAQLTLADGQEAYDQGVLDYQEGVATLEESRGKLPDARKKLDEGWVKYQDGLTKFQEGEADWLQGKADYDKGKADYDQGKADYDQGVIDWEVGRDAYVEGYRKLTQGETDYQAGLVTYEENAALLSAAKIKLDDAQITFNQGSAQYQQGLAEYNTQKAQFDGQVDGLRQMMAGSGLDFPTNDALLDALADPSLAAIVDGAAGAGTTATLLGYRQQLTDAAASLSRAGDAISEGRRALKKAREEYNDGVSKLADAQITLTDARKELDSGWAALPAAQEKLAEGAAKLEQARLELADASQILADAWIVLEDGKLTLDKSRLELDDAKTELDSGEADYQQGLLDLAAGEKELDDAQTSLTEAKVELDDGYAKYQTGRTDYEEGHATFLAEISNAKVTLTTARLDLVQGEADYNDGLDDYAQGEKTLEDELSDARREITKAQDQVDDLETCQWYVLGRDKNGGYLSYDQDAQRMGNLAQVFPVIFFLVAALVCLTTMTRLVEEKRVEIGGLKALGYGKLAIAAKYLSYGLLASLSGGLAGYFLGVILIPSIITNAWTILYTIPKATLLFPVGIALFSVGAACFTVVLSVLAACLGALTSVPAQLMRPKSPPLGKRVLLEHITPLWRRLTFTHKVTLRNLFRYKKRFWMTVIGIGGCAALIVAGFGLRDSIFGMMDLQYEQLYHYDATVTLSKNIAATDFDRLLAKLDGVSGVDGYYPSYETTITATTARGSQDATLTVLPRQEDLGDYLTLRTRLDHTPVTLPQEGAILSEKLADLLGVRPGDFITIVQGDTRTQLTVAGTTEQYIAHSIYLTPAAYSASFGKPSTINSVFLTLDDALTTDEIDDVSGALLPLAGVTGFSNLSTIRSTIGPSMDSINYAVVVIIIAAAALAFIVLYNLTNINITERQRELATLKVLGFYDKEITSYVSRENVILTLFGTGLGLVLGKLLHQYLVRTVEIDMLMFNRTPFWTSYAYAAALTLLFAALVNLVAHKRLQRIHMVESLKTVE